MKNLTLYSLTLFAATMVAAPLQAADDNATGDRSPALTKNAPATRLAPHSHPEEKLGLRLPRATSPTTGGGASDSTPSALPDRTRHFHPRDAK